MQRTNLEWWQHVTLSFTFLALQPAHILTQSKQTGKQWQMCEGYMSRGDILLTKERMENSIPYISLNSCTHKHTGHIHTLLFVGLFVCLCLFQHLLLRDPRLLLPVPLVVKQTVSISIKYVQVMNRHLKHKQAEKTHVFISSSSINNQYQLQFECVPN